jgi:hypothetical protein
LSGSIPVVGGLTSQHFDGTGIPIFMVMAAMATAQEGTTVA